MTNIQNRKISAISKYILISPKKTEKYLKLVSGKTYSEALSILLPLKRKVTVSIWKTLYSAAANAYGNFSIKKENLIISEAYVTRGSILKRMQPRAKGKGYKIEKIFSHITIKLVETKDQI
jgi:large subunit ribosomal protein L22